MVRKVSWARTLAIAATAVPLVSCGDDDSMQPALCTDDTGTVTVTVSDDQLSPEVSWDPPCSVAVFLIEADGETVSVNEQRNGWVRVSRRYDASCYNGESEYVDSGNDACSEDNGIVDGQFAEWVSAAYLSSERPDAQREPVVQPDAVTDDLRRKSVAAVALRIRLHPRSLAGAVSS